MSQDSHIDTPFHAPLSRTDVIVGNIARGISGMIPTVPIILCKTEDAAVLVQSALHSHVVHTPAVLVLDPWPDIPQNALVVTPLEVFGAEPLEMDFRINANLSEVTRKVLNAMIRLARTNKTLSIRNITAAVYGKEDISSKRKVEYQLRKLKEAGLIIRQERGPVRLLFGKWSPDAGTAKAAGIDITQFK